MQIAKNKMQMPNLNDRRNKLKISGSAVSDVDYRFELELGDNQAEHCVIAIVGGICKGHYQFAEFTVSPIGRWHSQTSWTVF